LYEWVTYSMYTKWHAVTLKWLPIIFMCLIQSLTMDYKFDIFLPTDKKSALM
jgi:hypothetical protein